MGSIRTQDFRSRVSSFFSLLAKAEESNILGESLSVLELVVEGKSVGVNL